MPRTFAGWTAQHYRRFRRDVPDAVVDRLVDRLGLGPDDVALDLGAGTGQMAIPLAARLGTVWALEPEPDMLALLRERGDGGASNVLCVLASDRDLSGLARALGDGSCALVTVANALHWMDAPTALSASHRLLRPGGAVAVVTHGVPLWLGESDWARALRRFVESWTGQEATSSCGSDDEALRRRKAELATAGFRGITVLSHRYEAVVDADYVIGHLYSAMPEDLVPVPRRTEFEAGVRRALEASGGSPLVEVVPVSVLVGR